MPSELGRLSDAVEPFQRQDRVRKLIGTAVENGARQRQEFLRHGLRIRKRGRLAGRIGINAFMHTIFGRDADAGAERMRAANFQPVILHDVELIGERIDGRAAELVVIVPTKAALVERDLDLEEASLANREFREEQC